MQPIPSPPTHRWLFFGLIFLAVLCAAGLVRPQMALAVTATATVTPTRTPSPTPTATSTLVRLPTFTPGPSPTPTLTPGSGNYVVQYGDTLLTIARRFDVSIPAIKTANGLTSDTIYAGQVLRIPTPTPVTPPPTKTPLPAGAFTYTVQAGDQLLVLARRFSVTVSAIRAANQLPSDTIRLGQVLVIPPPAPTQTPVLPDRSYTVKQGDQLLALARRFGVTVSALKATNHLTSDVIYPGQVLLIPTPAPATATSTPIPANAVVYLVKVGDRLSVIAARYGVTLAALESANRLSDGKIYVGQLLVIPNPTLRPMEYIVQRGDTLTSLAQRFGLTVEQIKFVNGMKGDTLFAGLKLIIPVP